MVLCRCYRSPNDCASAAWIAGATGDWQHPVGGIEEEDDDEEDDEEGEDEGAGGGGGGANGEVKAAVKKKKKAKKAGGVVPARSIAGTCAEQRRTRNAIALRTCAIVCARSLSLSLSL